MSSETVDVEMQVLLLPEPMLLLRGETVVAANRAAAQALGRTLQQVEGRPIEELTADASAARQYLRICARSRQMIPGAIQWVTASGDSYRLRCDGAVLEPASAQAEPLVMVRLRTAMDASRQFVVLTEKIQSLTGEVRRRRMVEDQLKALTQRLEHLVAERTLLVERRSDQLRALAMQLTQAEQRERRRLAQMLHDNLQQLLVAALLRCGDITSHTPGAAQAAADELRQLLTECMEVSRSLTAELSPPILYDAGLRPALSWLRRWMAKRYGLEVQIEQMAPEPPTEELRVLIFQMLRELLFNIVKHAGTHLARVSLRQEGGEIVITVEDHGCGFDQTHLIEPRASGGFGLFHLKERVDAVGGRFTVTSRIGHGTSVEMRLPAVPLALESTS